MIYTAAVIEESGRLRLDHLPFAEGQSVQVFVLAKAPTADRYPLRGTVLQYEGPTAPVAVEDWAALK
jgi:hypothetical protein